MRRLLKNGVNWEWTPEINGDFGKFKKVITEAPCLAYFDPKKDNYKTTDACNTGLAATLWQKEGEVKIPITFASSFLREEREVINQPPSTSAVTQTQ